MDSYGALVEAVIKGDVNTADLELREALRGGLDPRDILKNGLITGMHIMGERMRLGDAFIPEVLASASVMHEGLSILRPFLSELDVRPLGKVVIGTVEGDIHDIGKRIVGFMLKGAGFTVIDIGVDIKAEKFYDAIEEHAPDILGMSALLTTTAPRMKEVVDLLKERGVRGSLKIIIGGAAITEEYAKSICADGYAPDAGSAAQLAEQIIANQ